MIWELYMDAWLEGRALAAGAFNGNVQCINPFVQWVCSTNVVNGPNAWSTRMLSQGVQMPSTMISPCRLTNHHARAL